MKYKRQIIRAHPIKQMHERLRARFVQGTDPHVGLQREPELCVIGNVRRRVEEPAASEWIPALDKSSEMRDGEVETGLAGA